MNSTYSDLDSVLQLSKDAETLGFDLVAGQTWIYPTNLPVREYQFNITQAAIRQNTLVCLPTGLGKTFIAAVLMYNFFRWYPMGKIIFMAPTKPLVKQQQDACYNIMAIPVDATAEMTGNKLKTSRIKIWQEKRVFFITPQILQNDIDVVLNLAEQIKCIVIDEAHRALGKNANCEAIKKIYNVNNNFRVVALSATPGNNFNSVKDVISNLLISHIEARTNESIDVAPYVFKRKLETFVIPITGELLSVKKKYITILDKYTRPLLQFNIFSGNCANLTKGRIVLTMKEFKEKGRHHSKYGFILKTLNLCVTLYHGYELLIRHGLRGFLVFFDGTTSKPLINSIQELPSILDDVRNYLGPQDEVAMLPDGTIPELEGPIIYSHPKFEKLSEILLDHFKSIEDGDTKVMVFCEYRESVMEIYQMLLRQRPLIKPRVFLGQGAISQAQQIQAVKQFKSGVCNTLVSTCIGEEGLDVGEVDLIVCFDISSKSPIRMVQRMGRTGRKRDGRVVVLVTEGKEQQLLSECLVQKNNMISILESQPIKQHLNKQNPKMIPDNVELRCNKMFITVQKAELPKKKETKKKVKENKKSNSASLKTMFDNMSSQASVKNSEESDSAFKSKQQKSPQKGSRTSKKLQTPQKNQMDLRNMFSKINSTQNSLNISQTCQQEISEENSELTTLVTEIKSYLNESVINKSNCKLCDIFDNKLLCLPVKCKVKTEWKKPNLSILNSITSESLAKFSETFTKTNNCSVINEKCTTFKNSSAIQNNSLQFFNLESTFEVFSDDGTKSPEFKNDPILFNQSVGIFDSSKIYHTQKVDISEKKITKENENNLNNSVYVDDVIIESDSERSSPVLFSQRFVNDRRRIQRRLFSQSHFISENQEKVCSEVKTQSLIIKDNLSESNCSSRLVTNCSEVKTQSLIIKDNPSNCSSPLITNVKQHTNMSTPKNNSVSKNEYNMDFWDESLFEVCNSDESLFEEDCNVEKNSVNCETEKSMCEEKESDKNIKKNLQEETCKEIEKEQNKNDSDSDATLILSLDEEKIFKELEKQNLQSQNQPIKINESIQNISSCNKSLLSVTQAVELLNQSNYKSKITENNQSILLENKTESIISNNITQKENPINVNKNESKINFDDLEISHIFEDFENDSEEEFSLLSFSQKRKRKLQPNNTESNNNAKSIKLNSDKITDDKFSNSTFSNKNETSNTNLENKKSTDFSLKNKTENKLSNFVFLNKNENLTCGSNNKSLEKKQDDCSSSNILKDKHDNNEDEIFSQTTKKMRNKKFKLTTLKNMNNKSNDTINNTQSSPIKPVKKLINTNKKAVVISDSDDDFEDRPTMKLSKLITPVKKVERNPSVPSYSKSNDNTQKHSKAKSRDQISKKKTGRKKKNPCLFIDDEAVVEDDEHYVSDSNSETDYEELDNSFVSYTQNVHDQTDMRVKYLQSIRSPKFKPGAFKMPHQLPPQIYEDVFSQRENIENDTYMDDSFCVGNDESLSQRDGMSYLEMIEDELEKRENKKRKRVITISDSD